MPKISANDIMLALAHLTPEERADIAMFAAINKSTAKPRSSGGASKGQDFDGKFLLYYSKFREIMNSRGENLPRSPAFVKPGRLSLLKKGWVAVDDFISKSFPNGISNADRLKFYRISIEIALDYLVEIDRGSSIRQVCISMQNCSALINRQFPGYIEAGLIPLILSWGRFDRRGKVR